MITDIAASASPVELLGARRRGTADGTRRASAVAGGAGRIAARTRDARSRRRALLRRSPDRADTPSSPRSRRSDARTAPSCFDSSTSPTPIPAPTPMRAGARVAAGAWRARKRAWRGGRIAFAPRRSTSSRRSASTACARRRRRRRRSHGRSSGSFRSSWAGSPTAWYSNYGLAEADVAYLRYEAGRESDVGDWVDRLIAAYFETRRRLHRVRGAARGTRGGVGVDRAYGVDTMSHCCPVN